MSNPTFDRAFRAALEEARAAQQAPRVEQPTDTEELRQGIINFFFPVFAIFDALRESGVTLLGLNGPQRVSSGHTLRQRIEQDPVVYVLQRLNQHCALVITLATTSPPTRAADLIGAKWRCRVRQDDGPDLDMRLINSVELLCEWVARVIAEYECPPGVEYNSTESPPVADMPPALPTPGCNEQPSNTATTDSRERVIQLDADDTAKEL